MAPQVPAIIGQTVPPPALRQADTDQQIIETWIARHESSHTRGNYRRQAARLLAHVGTPLGRIRVSDLQAYLASLADQAPATRANATSAIKSLFSFAHELGYLPLNAGKAIKAPPIKNTLAECIMPETDALMMVRMEANPRNRALLTLTYGAGLRISEVCSLRWRDMAERDGGAGQATV